MAHVARKPTSDNYDHASGHKHLYAAYSHFGDDQLGARPATDLLWRSAVLLRTRVQPSLPRATDNIDRAIVLVMIGTGPQCAGAGAIDNAGHTRPARNTHYTPDLSDLLLQEALTSRGRVRSMRAALIRKFVRGGNIVAGLLGGNVRQWLRVLEDVVEVHTCRS